LLRWLRPLDALFSPGTGGKKIWPGF